MKKFIKILITISSITMLFSCSGEDGRDGIDGIDGNDAGQTIIYEIGDFENINFNSSNNYSFERDIPEDIDIRLSDVVQVFRFIGVDESGFDVWEQIPQTYFVDEGTFQYSFDFTVERINVFMVADFDLELLNDTNFTDNQIFRFAVTPGFTISSSNFSSSRSYSEIAKDAELIKL